LYANIIEHHARKGLRHCLRDWYLRLFTNVTFIRITKLRLQIFQFVASVAVTEKCCRLNIYRALQQRLLGPRDYLFLHARGKPRSGARICVHTRKVSFTLCELARCTRVWCKCQKY